MGVFSTAGTFISQGLIFTNRTDFCVTFATFTNIYIFFNIDLIFFFIVPDPHFQSSNKKIPYKYVIICNKAKCFYKLTYAQKIKTEVTFIFYFFYIYKKYINIQNVVCLCSGTVNIQERKHKNGVYTSFYCKSLKSCLF